MLNGSDAIKSTVERDKLVQGDVQALLGWPELSLAELSLAYSELTWAGLCCAVLDFAQLCYTALAYGERC